MNNKMNKRKKENPSKSMLPWTANKNSWKNKDMRLMIFDIYLMDLYVYLLI